MSSSRSKRARNAIIGVMVAGGVGLGLAATLPANAADGDVDTWILDIRASKETNARSFKIEWTGSDREATSVCYAISQGDERKYNQTGVLGTPVKIRGFTDDKCSSDKETGSVQFSSPNVSLTVVYVSLDRDGVSLPPLATQAPSLAGEA